MSVKKGSNALSSIQSGGLVVGDAHKTQQLEPELAFVIHERVPGVGVFLHVMSDKSTLKCLFKLVSDAPLPAALCTIAADHRAGSFEQIVRVKRKFSAVVDARYGESVARD